MNFRILFLVFFSMPLGLSLGLWGARSGTLQEYRAWFSTIEEVPPLDMHDVKRSSITDPIFAQYFTAQEPGLFRRLLITLGLVEKPWDLSVIIEPLKQVTARYMREKKRLEEREFFVKKDDNVIVFGNLHGSIFSFMRDLDELERRGLINNQLQLKDNCYLIFLGDILNYSPHTFELLDLILALIEKNGDRIIYIRNEQEGVGFRDNLAATRDQLIQWGRLWGNRVARGATLPFHTELNNFFNVLPDSVILKHTTDKKNHILCVGKDPEIDLSESPTVPAIIVGELWNKTTWISKGLNFFGFTKGAAVWSLISCPNRFYQDVVNFHYDSFIILHVGSTFQQTVLEFFNHDIASSEPFKTEQYSLTLGFPLEKGPSVLALPQLVMGSTVTLTGAVGAVGRGVKEGLEAVSVRINREGGLNGKLVHPVVLDDSYIPRIARRNVTFLKKEYGTNLLVGPVGTPTLNAYFDWIRAGDFYVFFPVTGGEQFRLSDLPYVIHYRKSYPQEVDNLVDLICKNYQSTRFAIIYQDDAFGQQLAAAAHTQLRKNGIQEWTDIPFKQNELLLTSQIKKLLDSGAEAIGFFFTSNMLAQYFLTKVGGGFLVGKHLFSISFLDNNLFRGYLTEHGLKFTFSYVSPNPFKGDSEIVKEFIEEMKIGHHDPDSNNLEGYIAASLFAEAVRHVSGEITGEKLMRWFESLKNYDFKGLNLTFNPATRGFELPAWIRMEDDRWVKA